MNDTSNNPADLSNKELAKRISYGKGQIAYLQAMVTKRSAEMVCVAIRGGSIETQESIRQAMMQHLTWIEETGAANSEYEGELESRHEQALKRK